MKLSEAKAAYYAQSGTASTVARQIALAGIAVVWLFNAPVGPERIALPEELVLVALLLVITLALDLLQYVLASLIWSVFARRLEHQMSHCLEEDPEGPASPFLNWPALGCFWAKMLVVILAYWLLARFLFKQL